MEVRDALPADADRLVELIAELGFTVDEAGVTERLSLLAANREPVVVAENDGRLVGMLDWHVMPTIHRERPVGRIVALVVGKGSRGRGAGTALVREAEARMRLRGCEKLEVTSNIGLDRAHAFYERYGFERTSFRFAKEL